MLSNILNICRKELMGTFRDRKALRQALALPIFLGILYAVMNPAINSLIESRAEEPLTVPVQGIEYAGPALIAVLAEFEITLEPFEGDMAAAIEAGEEAAGLVIPAGFADQVAGEQTATLTLLTNNSAGGLFRDPSLLTPVALETRDLATPAQRAGMFASMMLPILVGIVAAQGGMFIAIDVTAGEKERGTLESLLVTPAGDGEILIGKLLAVFTIAMLPLTLTLLGYWGASNLLPESMTNGAVLPLSLVLKAILITLPLALLLDVILMIISVRTKAFKDAQTSVTPVLFTVMLAAIAAAFVPPSHSVLYLIPIYGTSAVVGTLAVGGVVPANAVLFTVVGSLVAAALGIALALKLFDRERLLYSA
jgi:sodium transport system permease protein